MKDEEQLSLMRTFDAKYKNFRFIFLDKVRVRDGGQVRVCRSKEAVERYTEIYLQSQYILPPVTVLPEEDGTYWLVDGHHRYEAAQEAQVVDIPAVVLSGVTDEGEILEKAVAANITHGLPMGVADRKHAARLFIALDPEKKKYSDRQIAALCGLSPTTVGHVRKWVQGKEEADATAEEVSKMDTPPGDLLLDADPPEDPETEADSRWIRCVKCQCICAPDHFAADDSGWTVSEKGPLCPKCSALAREKGLEKAADQMLRETAQKYFSEHPQEEDGDTPEPAKLAPCPCCGEVPKIKGTVSRGKKKYYVYHEQKSCSVVISTVETDTEQEAIQTWNAFARKAPALTAPVPPESFVCPTGASAQELYDLLADYIPDETFGELGELFAETYGG